MFVENKESILSSLGFYIILELTHLYMVVGLVFVRETEISVFFVSFLFLSQSLYAAQLSLYTISGLTRQLHREMMKH